MTRKTTKKNNSVHKGLKKMKIFKLHYPFNAQEYTGGPFHQNFNFILRRDHQKNFLWASRLWVGRRKEPILGYVPKNDEKKNSVHKGLIIQGYHEWFWFWMRFKIKIIEISDDLKSLNIRWFKIKITKYKMI